MHTHALVHCTQWLVLWFVHVQQKEQCRCLLLQTTNTASTTPPMREYRGVVGRDTIQCATNLNKKVRAMRLFQTLDECIYKQYMYACRIRNVNRRSTCTYCNVC